MQNEHALLLEQVLKPVVRVRAAKARGSGTIIYSGTEGVYAMTNHHVIAGNVEHKEVWDELLQRKIEKEYTSVLEVDLPRLTEHGEQKSLTTTQADIVLTNQVQDLALLRLRDEAPYPTATLLPEADAGNVPLLVPIACCGAAMGEKPIVTFGHLNGVQIEIDNCDFGLSSAPSIFGNSGGAVFTCYSAVGKETGWRYFGIPSRIRVAFIGFGADAVTHMGYFIPIARIYKWLRDNCYEFLWTDATKADCDRRRVEKRERELAVVLTREKR